MFCQKCGKEISAQAKFCNHYGNPVTNEQVNVNPQPQPAQQAPSKPQKKKSAGKRIFAVLLVAVVFFGARFITESFVSSQQKSESTFEQGFNAGVGGTADVAGSCTYGALYQNGYLTYGSSRIYMPNFHLISGGGDGADLLASADEKMLVNAYRQLEVNLSYDASTGDGLLKSYESNPDWSNVSMVDFSKKTVGGFPVISYIIKATSDGMDMLVSEIIIFPSKTPSQTVRLGIQCLTEVGPNAIQNIINTLEISSDYTLTSADTGVMGLNRITVK